jgi:short-subunit dehydrogenase
MNLYTKEKNRLKSRYGDWAVVTGASSGIGKEISKLLASAGFNLVINARNQEKLDEVKIRFGIKVHHSGQNNSY